MARKKKSYSGLKTDLDRLFSVLVRRGSADSQGYAHCVTCQQRRSWKELQAGHFVSRVHLAARWHPENVAPQCSACNILRRGNSAEYAAWGLKTYGPDWVDRMVSLKRKTVKYSTSDLLEMIEDVQKELDNLTNVR